MTRTLTLIVGLAVAALAVVPTALGEGMLAGSSQPDVKQAAIVSENTPESALLRAERLRSEGLNRRYGLGEFAPSAVSTYKDANERVVEPQSVRAERFRSEGLNRRYGLGEFAPSAVSTYKDANERADVPTSTVEAPVATSPSELEWPQLGIGFGLGILLVAGLWLAMRMTRPRPLAH